MDSTKTPTRYRSYDVFWVCLNTEQKQKSRRYDRGNTAGSDGRRQAHRRYSGEGRAQACGTAVREAVMSLLHYFERVVARNAHRVGRWPYLTRIRAVTVEGSRENVLTRRR